MNKNELLEKIKEQDEKLKEILTGKTENKPDELKKLEEEVAQNDKIIAFLAKENNNLEKEKEKTKKLLNGDEPTNEDKKLVQATKNKILKFISQTR